METNLYAAQPAQILEIRPETAIDWALSSGLERKVAQRSVFSSLCRNSAKRRFLSAIGATAGLI